MVIVEIFENAILRNVIIAFVLLNVAGFLVMLHDKRQTWYDRPRVSKGLILFLAAIGGSVGVKFAQMFLKHMRLRQPFAANLNLILFGQVIILATALLFVNETTRTWLEERRAVQEEKEREGPRIFGPAAR
jgi:uncharacterized membrane protein YsdA (DUF1294 family)